MSSPSSAVVVGGGVAGLCSAYYLRKRGLDVTVLESNRVGSGASWGNGGWICPAQAGPLPEPGLTWYGIRSLLDPSSALYFQRRRLPELTPWLLRFWSYCNERDHARGVEALAMLGRGVFDLVDEMVADGVEFELHRQGMLIAARDADHARQELAKLEPMRAYGYELPEDVLTGAELHALEPALAPEVDAGVVVAQHWHVRPDSFTEGIAAALRRMDVEVVEGAEVHDFVTEGGRLGGVRSAAGDYRADAYLLAAGAWTNSLAAMVGVEFPMEAGKGYSFFVKPSVLPSHSILLADVHVGCTPLGDKMRIGGTMEFSGLNSRLDERRIADITTAARDCFQPWRSPEIEQPWAGMRPITPDGLPVLDSAGSLSNLFVATGYAMQGVTLAGPAGEAMAELIATGEKPELLEPFGIERLRGRRRRRRNG
ncbi:MAG TPA: FAD-dependent oxidoreductase [Solirubrobacterales bacterium]|nr:FAD-dependent oxidoreductase [Solirubrobacterales bacterium]